MVGSHPELAEGNKDGVGMDTNIAAHQADLERCVIGRHTVSLTHRF